jgi:hypothetical protein
MPEGAEPKARMILRIEDDAGNSGTATLDLVPLLYGSKQAVRNHLYFTFVSLCEAIVREGAKLSD